MNRIIKTFLLAVFISACAGGQTPAPSRPVGQPAPPSLVVLITVDQFQGDYLDRFGPQLKGGLARLSRGGAWFANAHHDHAITETAPGHATLLSGRFPRSTGIMNNRMGVGDAAAPLIGEPGAIGASPQRFQGTTLVDWIRAKYPKSRALSVSMKDRGAILPIGRSKSEVYWYSPDGRFTTSLYYRNLLPAWVEEFNARHMPQSYAGKRWSPLLPDSAYHEPDSVDIEMGGRNFTFPHDLPADSAQAASAVRGTPFMDEIALALALDGVNALSLGASGTPDVLAVSLSATDLIGHGYGSDSKEIHDQILRLDRSVGIFLDSLFKLRDSSRVALAITGDHGMGRIPELVRNVQPVPQRVDLSLEIASLKARLAAAGVNPLAVDVDEQIVLVDRKALGRRERAADSALAVFADEVRHHPGVGRVDRFRDLLRADTVRDTIARRWLHQFPAESNVEMVITLTPYSIWSGIVATHGSPYQYDSHVPLIFYGPWFRPGRYSEFVRTVDIAPTLGAVVGVAPSERIDGVVLRDALIR